MAKNLKQVIILFVLAATCAELKAQDVKFEIKGKIGGYSAPAKAYLMYFNGTKQVIDSAILTNGVFEIVATTDAPRTATLFLNTKGSGFMAYDAGFQNFYLESGRISVTNGDSLQNAKIYGGQLNKDYASLTDALKVLDDKSNKVNDVFFTASPERQKSTKFRDSVLNEVFKVEDEKKVVALVYLKNHRSSLVSLTALAQYAGLYPDSRLVEPAFNLLSPEVRSSKSGSKYAADIAQMKKAAIGVYAPDFSMPDTLGNLVSVHDYRGKFLLIDFWASWCGPCRAQNPDLVKIYDLFKGKNFNILGVSSDVAKAKAEWLRAIRDDHLPWAQVADLTKGSKNDAMILYGIQNIPQNVLISPDGKILEKNLRGEDLKIALQKYLK